MQNKRRAQGFAPDFQSEAILPCGEEGACLLRPTTASPLIFTKARPSAWLVSLAAGKSTLGRSILQLYKQTDGRTMYFLAAPLMSLRPSMCTTPSATWEPGRSICCHPEEIRGIPGGIRQAPEQEQYLKHAELTKLRKEANDAMLDVATLVGGLIVAKDMKPVGYLHGGVQISKGAPQSGRCPHGASAGLDDADFALKKAKEAGKSTTSAESSLKKAKG